MLCKFFGKLSCLFFLGLLFLEYSALAGAHKSLFSKTHYEGSLERTVNTTVSRSPVSMDVSKNSKEETVDVKGIDKKIIFSMKLSNESYWKQTFDLFIPSISQTVFHFKYNKVSSVGQKCFSAESKTAAQLCFNDKQFALAFDNYSLKGIFFTPVKPTQSVNLPIPDRIDINQAVQIAKKSNTANKIALEKALQAKADANAAYLRLLPQVGVGTVISVVSASFSPESILGAIPTVAPFLFPDNWQNAKKMKAFGRAADLGGDLMRANLISQIEGLSYAFMRDENISLFLYGVLGWLADQGVTLTKLSPSLMEDFGKIVDSTYLAYLYAYGVFQEDQRTFGQALGEGPGSVLGVDYWDEGEPIDTAVLWDGVNGTLSSAGLADLAVSRSFELEQINSLAEAAQHEKYQKYFKLINPAADASLNFGMGEDAKSDKSAENILEFQRQDIETKIRGSVAEAYDGRNFAIASYNSRESEKLTPPQRLVEESNRLYKYLKDVNTGTYPFVRNDFEVMLEEYIHDFIENETLIAQYRIARGKVARLQLLGGFYDQLYLNINTMLGSSGGDVSPLSSPSLSNNTEHMWESFSEKTFATHSEAISQAEPESPAASPKGSPEGYKDEL